MKRLFVLFLVSLSAFVSQAQNTDSVFVVNILRNASADILYFARQFLGVPYVAHTLEVLSTHGNLIVPR